jgi:monovalent cation:H+ antiporter, CPA1 family
MLLALSLFLSCTALMAWVNTRWLGWPTSVGVTVLSAVVSLCVVVCHQFITPLTPLMGWTASWQFNDLLLHGALCFLLFAGALHVDIHAMQQERWMILLLSTLGVVISASLSGTLIWLVLDFLSLSLPWLVCFLFGVLISPTDAVVAADALERAALTPTLKAKILGESLFNDGTAVLLFSFVLALLFPASSHAFFTQTQAFIPNAIVQWLLFFAWQVGGGMLIGLILGRAFLWLIGTVNQPTVELLLTLACATLTYALTDVLYASAPIAVVMAGLMIGHHGKQTAMSEQTQTQVFSFWSLLDELLNVGLFVLIGAQLLRISFDLHAWPILLLVIPIALLARYVSVALPVYSASLFRTFSPHTLSWMTWGGLRGGISLAMAMAMPPFPGKDLLLLMTYLVVVFSIVVQGGLIMPWLSSKRPLSAESDAPTAF